MQSTDTHRKHAAALADHDQAVHRASGTITGLTENIAQMNKPMNTTRILDPIPDIMDLAFVCVHDRLSVA